LPVREELLLPAAKTLLLASADTKPIKINSKIIATPVFSMLIIGFMYL
jgi:hypothetical protein